MPLHGVNVHPQGVKSKDYVNYSNLMGHECHTINNANRFPSFDCRHANDRSDRRDFRFCGSKPGFGDEVGAFCRLSGRLCGRYAGSISGSPFIGLSRASPLRFWAVAARRNSSFSVRTRREARKAQDALEMREHGARAPQRKRMENCPMTVRHNRRRLLQARIGGDAGGVQRSRLGYARVVSRPRRGPWLR
jgi:hypothetical protein